MLSEGKLPQQQKPIIFGSPTTKLRRATYYCCVDRYVDLKDTNRTLSIICQKTLMWRGYEHATVCSDGFIRRSALFLRQRCSILKTFITFRYDKCRFLKHIEDNVITKPGVLIQCWLIHSAEQYIYLPINWKCEKIKLRKIQLHRFHCTEKAIRESKREVTGIDRFLSEKL